MRLRNSFYVLREENPIDGGTGAPAPEAPEAPPAVDWDGLVDASENPEPTSAEPEPSEEPKAPEPVVEPAPAPEPATPPTPAPEPSVPVEPTKAESTPEPVAPSTPPVTAEELAALRTAELARLEQTYALTADQAAALLTEPETVLPKLAAKVHQEVVAQVLAMMQSQIPQAVDSITTARVRESEAKKEFFGVWPELQGYEQQVLAAGAMFRQINPKATKEQAVQAIGQLAMQALGLQRSSAPTATPAAAPQQTVFQPAGTAARGSTPAVKPPPTVWDEMTADSW